MTFAQIFAPIYSLDVSTLVAGSHHWSEDFGQLELTDFTENHVVYHGHRLIFFLALDFNSIHLEDIKHVWYFDLILEQIVLICLVSPINKVHVFGSVLCLEQQQEKTIMPSVLKSYN